MDHESTKKSGKAVANAAEARMRQWALEAQRDRASGPVEEGEPPEQDVRPYLAISRQVGVDDVGLARRLGQLLGWESFDRSLLDYLAEHFQTRRHLVEVVDEKSANWFEETLGKWFNSRVVTQSEYIAKVEKFIWMAARNQNCIFVGRGCHLILPPEAGLSVFVAAPRTLRIDHVAKTRDCSLEEAEKHVDKIGKERHEFYRQYFQAEMGDMEHHDLGVNMRQMGGEDAAQLLVEQLRRRFPDSLTA